MQIWNLIFRRTLPPRLDEPPLSDGAWDTIQRCWIRKPSERPRIKDVAQRMMALYRSAFATTNVRNPFYYEMLRKLSLLPSTSSTDGKDNGKIKFDILYSAPDPAPSWSTRPFRNLGSPPQLHVRGPRPINPHTRRPRVVCPPFPVPVIYSYPSVPHRVCFRHEHPHLLPCYFNPCH